MTISEVIVLISFGIPMLLVGIPAIVVAIYDEFFGESSSSFGDSEGA